jgi:hypothetical protein
MKNALGITLMSATIIDMKYLPLASQVQGRRLRLRTETPPDRGVPDTASLERS